jgi:hypothetical protein
MGPITDDTGPLLETIVEHVLSGVFEENDDL